MRDPKPLNPKPQGCQLVELKGSAETGNNGSDSHTSCVKPVRLLTPKPSTSNDFQV